MLVAPEDPACETIQVPVLKVFDGDGFLARIHNLRRDSSHEVAIRLGFIDAPEMGQPGGREARDFLVSLIGGKSVELVVLLKMDTGGIVDRHGRIVAVPYLLADGMDDQGQSRSMIGPFLGGWASPAYRNIELEMVLNGWAWVLDRYDPDPRYFDALSDAQKNRRGIWAFENNEHPWEFKRRRYNARQAEPKARPAPDLFASQGKQVACPTDGCSGKLVERSGRYGRFVGCSNFPGCRYSRNIAD